MGQDLRSGGDLHAAGHSPGQSIAAIRSDVSLMDRESALQLIDAQVRGLRRSRFRGDGRGSRMRLQHAGWGPLTLNRIGMWMDVTVDLVPIPDLIITTITSGRIRAHDSAGPDVQVRGDSRLLAPQTQPRYDVEGHDSIVVQVPFDEVVSAACEITGEAAHQLRFLSSRPLSAAANRGWWSALRLVREELALADSVSPLRLASMLQMISAGALASFPNSTMTLVDDSSDGWVGPAVIVRAVDYIEAHAHEPIRVHQIAVAAGVGPRQLRIAFRRHLDTTPSHYLRIVRMHRVHERLVALGEPLAVLAHDAGFASESSLARAYGGVFGRPPRGTGDHR